MTGAGPSYTVVVNHAGDGSPARYDMTFTADHVLDGWTAVVAHRGEDGEAVIDAVYGVGVTDEDARRLADFG